MEVEVGAEKEAAFCVEAEAGVDAVKSESMEAY